MIFLIPTHHPASPPHPIAYTLDIWAARSLNTQPVSFTSRLSFWGVGSFMPHNTQDLHSQTRHPPHTPWSGRANHGTTKRFPPPHIFTHTFAPVPRHHPLLPQISAPILRLYFSVTSFFSHIHNLPKCYIHSFPELPYYCLQSVSHLY